MPRKQEHDAFEKLILGYVTGMTDLMDAPAKSLGSHHRVFFHDLSQVMVLSFGLGGNVWDNVIAGLIHIILDDMMTEGQKLIKMQAKKNIRKGKENNLKFIKNLFDIIWRNRNG